VKRGDKGRGGSGKEKNAGEDLFTFLVGWGREKRG